MAEYISREAVVRHLKGYSEKERNSNSPYGMITSSVLDKVERAFSEMPATDVQPVVHAYWIKLPKALNPNENPCKCSNCGHILSFMNGYPKSKYCDECGAKMDIIYEDDKIRAIKVTSWGNDARNLTDEETDIYNDQLEAEAKTIDEISLL